MRQNNPINKIHVQIQSEINLDKVGRICNCKTQLDSAGDNFFFFFEGMWPLLFLIIFLIDSTIDKNKDGPAWRKHVGSFSGWAFTMRV